MSEPKLISPMLDNFIMGGPISSHDGVCCCPAMEKNTDGKYIVKIISVPSSASQLEAMLLSGAYPTKEAALCYFKDVADGVIREIEILNQLSALDGFLPFSNHQCITSDDQSGYEIYMLSPYKRSLSRQFIKQPLTQLGAINLGLDMCSALAACRRSGYLYVDLKPNNIFVSDTNQYKISDLGFISLSSLKYSSLPDKYRSEYTAPEIQDAFSTLNTTMDVYALGLVLYQAYNNGNLPFTTEITPGSELCAPAYADYEMAEIILKACAPNPEDRWQDPIEMGQALVSYMQRNGANDSPIVAPVVSATPATVTEQSAPEKDEEQDTKPTEAETITDIEVISETVVSTEAENDASVIEENELLETPSLTQETTLIEDESQTESDEQPTASIEEFSDATSEEEPGELSQEPIAYHEDDLGNMSFLTEENDLSDEEALAIDYATVSEEVSQILNQADELVAHPVPDPVVAPEAIDVPVPELPEPESEHGQTQIAIALDEDQEDAPGAADSDVKTEEQYQEEYEDAQVLPRKKTARRWVAAIVTILILAALGAAAFYYYLNYYLQPVHSIKLNGSIDTLQVAVDTDLEDSALLVVCADPHGNQIPAPLVNGIATFTGLVPDTAYTVKVQVNGFHELTGITSTAYSTPAQTNIVQFSAIAGPEEGSAILSFTVEGPDASQWSVKYSAEDEEEKIISFPGHMVTVNGLTIGKEYFFRLEAEDPVYISGNDSLMYTAQALILAQNLTITSCQNDTLQVKWNAPDGFTVESWAIRCYDEGDYSESIITSSTEAVFENINDEKAYTVEVTAAGMSVSQRTFVSANSVTVSDFAVDTSTPGQLALSWKTNREPSENGWILQYSCSNSDVYDSIVCSENNAWLVGPIPGETYTFALTDLNNTMFLGQPFTYQVPDAEPFSVVFDGYPSHADDMDFRMCIKPDRDDWNRYDLRDSDYTTTFTLEQKAAFLVRLNKSYSPADELIVTVFVIRDDNGKIVSTKVDSRAWGNMWYRGYCELDLPALPETPGNYTVDVYFNSGLAGSQEFTVTQ